MSVRFSEHGNSPALFETLLASGSSPARRSDVLILSTVAAIHVAIVAFALWLSPGALPESGLLGVTTPAMILAEEYWAAPNLAETPKVGAAVRQPARRRRDLRPAGVPALAALPLPKLDKVAEAITSSALDWIDQAEEELKHATEALAAAADFSAPGNGDDSVDVARAPLTLDRLKIGPTTTHYTVAPELLNRDEIVNLLNQRYPNELRMLGRGGLTTLWLLIDQDGKARKALVFASSGHEGFDAAALDAVSVMKFSPAQNNGRTTPVWVQLPVRFQVARTY